VSDLRVSLLDERYGRAVLDLPALEDERMEGFRSPDACSRVKRSCAATSSRQRFTDLKTVTGPAPNRAGRFFRSRSVDIGHSAM